MAKIKINKGDLFSFEIENKFAVGVILKVERQKINVGILSKLLDSKPQYDLINNEINSMRIVVVASTMSFFFDLKRWIIFGNQIIDFNLTNYFKIETPEGTYVCDVNLNKIRKATAEEAKTLNYFSDVTPSVVVTATKMYFGLEPMDNAYKEYFVK